MAGRIYISRASNPLPSVGRLLCFNSQEFYLEIASVPIFLIKSSLFVSSFSQTLSNPELRLRGFFPV